MAAKTGSEKETAGAKDKKTKKGSPLLLLTSALLLVLICLVALVFTGIIKLPFLKQAAAVPQAAAEQAQPRFLYSLHEFQVNLADSGSKRFLRTTIDLAYDDKKLAKEIEARESEVRSVIISVLRGKHTADLGEPGGMKGLEQDLLKALNDTLSKGEVKAIYYREFIFQ